MLTRLLQLAFAVLVAVVFGCMPTLALASPANESPPIVQVVPAPEVAQAENMDLDFSADTGDVALVDRRPSMVREQPGYPLRE